MATALAIIARPGLAVGDFAFGLYLDGVAQDASGLTATEIDAGSVASAYRVAALPDPGAAEFWTLTWDDGVQRGFRRWPAQTAVPPNLVLPLRQAGVVLADLNPRLYLDGAVVSTAGLALADIGSPLHDYRLSGLAAPPVGSRYALQYSFGAVYQLETWPELVANVNVFASGAGSTRYLEILAAQRPFPYGVDDLQRTLFSCNYNALAAAPVTNWTDEVAHLIELAGLGTFGSDIFIGPSVDAPAGDGPYIHVIDTGGITPDETHNGSKYERLSVQIIVRAADYVAGDARAVAIWRALDGRRNLTVAA